MKRLWIELQRWSRQGVPYCYDCPPPNHKGKRMRRHSAWAHALMHHHDTMHRVTVKRFG